MANMAFVFCEKCQNHRAFETVASQLTHCGLVMPYDEIDLGQYWPR